MDDSDMDCIKSLLGIEKHRHCASQKCLKLNFISLFSFFMSTGESYSAPPPPHPHDMF